MLSRRRNSFSFGIVGCVQELCQAGKLASPICYLETWFLQNGRGLLSINPPPRGRLLLKLQPGLVVLVACAAALCSGYHPSALPLQVKP